MDQSVYTKHRRSSLRLAGLCIAVFVAIATIRVLILMGSGASVPFWDQWGGENSIFSAFQSGTLTWGQMVAAHNEHRIFWTRLLTIALFELNGRQWDNQVEAFASNLIYCVALVVPVYVTSLNRRRSQTIAVALIMLFVGALPFGWENTLVGFQSQFYINSLLAMLAIATAAIAPVGVRSGIVLSVLILFSFASMANGVLSAFTCAAVLIARGFADERLLRRSSVIAVILVLIGIAGYLSTPSPSHHAALKAQNVAELFAAFWITSSWPFPLALGQLVLFLPAPVWLLLAGKSHRTSADYFFLGLNGLGLLNAAAIAYSRGHDLVEVTSRYTDTVLPSSIAAAYFAVRLATLGNRTPVRFFGHFGYIAVVVGLTTQTISQMPKLQERAYFLRMSTINTADFLDGDDSAFKGKPHGHVPYPDPVRLGESLRKNDQSASLPTSLLGVRALSGHLPKLAGRCYLASSAEDHFATISPDCGAEPIADGSIVSIATGPLSAALMSMRQALDFSVFARGEQVAIPVPNSSSCALDGFNDAPTSRVPLTTSIDTPARLMGWAPPPRFTIYGISLPRLKIVLRGDHAAYEFNTGVSRIERPDVAKFFNDPSYQWSGFDTFIDPRDIETDTYRIMVANDGRAPCDTGHNVEIVNPSRPFSRF